MDHTYEVRWFFEEPNPALEAWFGRKGPGFNETTSRKDYYLPLSANKGLGIKLREGNIEIKKLIRQQRKKAFVPNMVEGKIQHWVKSSFTLDEKDQLSKQIIQDKKYEWIELKKERMGFQYHFTNRGKLVGNKTLHEEIPEGCQVEYTRITIHNTPLYTFGLEAFSSVGREKQNLNAGMKEWINSMIDIGAFGKNKNPLIQLPAELSIGYPEFLEKISYGVNPDLY